MIGIDSSWPQEVHQKYAEYQRDPEAFREKYGITDSLAHEKVGRKALTFELLCDSAADLHGTNPTLSDVSLHAGLARRYGYGNLSNAEKANLAQLAGVDVVKFVDAKAATLQEKVRKYEAILSKAQEWKAQGKQLVLKTLCLESGVSASYLGKNNPELREQVEGIFR